MHRTPTPETVGSNPIEQAKTKDRLFMGLFFVLLIRRFDLHIITL